MSIIISDDILALFEVKEEILFYLKRIIPQDVDVKIYLTTLSFKSGGYTYHTKKLKKFTITINSRLKRKHKKLVFLHELAHITTILNSEGKKIKSHGQEFFLEHRKIFYNIGKFILSQNDFEQVKECFSSTNNYKQFNLCLKANFWNSPALSSDNNAFFLMDTSKVTEKFVYLKKRYKILKKNSMYYTVYCENDGKVLKLNKYIKVLPL